jgi:hypothetical protein
MRGAKAEIPRRRIRFAATLAAVACGAMVLYRFDPGAQSGANFYPRCLLHEYTGLYCPGCGAARAFHALLHGHVLTSAHFNPIVPLLFVPVVGLGFIRSGVEAFFPNVRFGEQRNIKASWTIGALVIVFSVLRNVPSPPFSYLAPPNPNTAITPAAHAPGDDGNVKSVVPFGTTPG